ncbi:Pc09g00010, partial [Penicillium rubens Wisconsin 54-1255]
IRRNWNYYERDPSQGFDVLLEWCINVVGVKEENARGHFRHAGQRDSPVQCCCGAFGQRSTELAYKDFH